MIGPRYHDLLPDLRARFRTPGALHDFRTLYEIMLEQGVKEGATVDESERVALVFLCAIPWPGKKRRYRRQLQAVFENMTGVAHDPSLQEAFRSQLSRAVLHQELSPALLRDALPVFGILAATPPLRVTDATKQLGRAVKDLAPLPETRIRDEALPPVGAGRFASANIDELTWEPISQKAWRRLADETRGGLVLGRALAWLGRNARLSPSGLSVEATDLFPASLTMHAILCRLYRQREPPTSINAVQFLLAAVAGIPAHAMSIEATRLLIDAYGRMYCEADEPEPSP